MLIARRIMLGKPAIKISPKIAGRTAFGIFGWQGVGVISRAGMCHEVTEGLTGRPEFSHPLPLLEGVLYKLTRAENFCPRFLLCKDRKVLKKFLNSDIM